MFNDFNSPLNIGFYSPKKKTRVWETTYSRSKLVEDSERKQKFIKLLARFCLNQGKLKPKVWLSTSLIANLIFQINKWSKNWVDSKKKRTSILEKSLYIFIILCHFKLILNPIVDLLLFSFLRLLII